MIELDWDHLDSVKAPCTRPRGLTWDGTTLWLSDEITHKIYRINPETGKLKYSRHFDGIPAGMAWDGKHLWVADSENKELVKLNRKCEVITSFKVDKVKLFSGLAYDGNLLWQGDYSGVWFQINPEHGKIVNAFKWGPRVCGLAYDGSEFWYVEDWTPALHQISQILGTNSIDYKIKGFPTGLAWDGSHFWIIDSSSQTIKKFDPAFVYNAKE